MTPIKYLVKRVTHRNRLNDIVAANNLALDKKVAYFSFADNKMRGLELFAI